MTGPPAVACLLLQVVIDRLISSACFSHQRGLSLEPMSSYQVLYDFVLARGNYKHAAAAMLAYARRLRAMAASPAVGSSHSDKQQLQQVVLEVQAAYGELSWAGGHQDLRAPAVCSMGEACCSWQLMDARFCPVQCAAKQQAASFQALPDILVLVVAPCLPMLLQMPASASCSCWSPQTRGWTPHSASCSSTRPQHL